MAGRPKKNTSMKDELAKQEAVVAKSKAKYDADVKKLKDFYAKQNAIKKKELLEAVEKSSRSYEEIMGFLKESEGKNILPVKKRKIYMI